MLPTGCAPSPNSCPAYGSFGRRPRGQATSGRPHLQIGAFALKNAIAHGPWHITGKLRWKTMGLYKKGIVQMFSLGGEPPSWWSALGTTTTLFPLALLLCARLFGAANLQLLGAATPARPWHLHGHLHFELQCWICLEDRGLGCSVRRRGQFRSCAFLPPLLRWNRDVLS